MSALVCGTVFLEPLIHAMLGRPTGARIESASLGADLPANDERQDDVRARIQMVNGERVVTPFAVQDLSMLATPGDADALIVRPVRAPAAAAGKTVPILLLDS